MENRTTNAKALKINLDLQRYGTFAEIGAGQEVARRFFLAGKASGTVAKSMSAYDMIFSDEIYGKEKSGRYVVESRLVKMLDKEFDLLQRRLNDHRGDDTAFFALANTVATGTPETPRCHGWMGIKFQSRPKGEANTIVLHVRMMDRQRIQQQETLGVLGVNLMEAAFYHLDEPETFIDNLIENLRKGQIVIDVIKFSGPDVKHFDNLRMNLSLVARGVSEAILFDSNLDILNISDTVHNKGLLFHRGTFKPITNTNLQVLEKGLEQMKNEFKGITTLPVFELTVPKKSQLDMEDYVQRIQILSKLGYHTLVSQFHLFYQLKNFFRRYTQQPIVIVLDASKLERIFDEVHYKNLDGGILEGLGKLLDPQTKLYFYPYKTDKICLTVKTFHPPATIQHLFSHFMSLKQIADISACDEADNYYHSDEVRKMIWDKDKTWEKLVPPQVTDLIRKSKSYWA